MLLWDGNNEKDVWSRAFIWKYVVVKKLSILLLYIMNKTTYLGYIFLGNETIENYFFIPFVYFHIRFRCLYFGLNLCTIF